MCTSGFEPSTHTYHQIIAFASAEEPGLLLLCSVSFLSVFTETQRTNQSSLLVASKAPIDHCQFLNVSLVLEVRLSPNHSHLYLNEKGLKNV